MLSQLVSVYLSRSFSLSHGKKQRIYFSCNVVQSNSFLFLSTLSCQIYLYFVCVVHTLRFEQTLTALLRFIVTYVQSNTGGFTIFGWTVDRMLINTIFFIELSLVFFVLGKTITVTVR